MSIETIEGHTLLPRLIHSNSVVLDVGANEGNFSRQMQERFGCVCHAVEANPAVAARIPQRPGVHVHHLAVAGRAGQIRMMIHEDDECSSLVPQPGEEYIAAIDVTAVTLENFVAGLNLKFIDVLKLDIEGCEIEVLDSCSDELLSRVGQLTLELHDFTGQVSRADIDRVLTRLRRLEFFTIKMARKSYIDTLAINRRRCDVSLAECLAMRYGVRNWHGFKRMVGRWLGAPPPPNARPAAARRS